LSFAIRQEKQAFYKNVLEKEKKSQIKKEKGDF